MFTIPVNTVTFPTFYKTVEAKNLLTMISSSFFIINTVINLFRVDELKYLQCEN